MKRIPNQVLVKHNRNWGFSEEIVKKLANEALIYYGFRSSTELSIFFVGRKKAKDLNIKYRNRSYIPQVLGFPMSTETDTDGLIRLGDVVICNEKLKYEVKYQKSTNNKVLLTWLKHGVENLLKK